MSIQLGDIAPNFTAESTQGTVSLHEYLAGGWGILFSYPRTSRPSAPPSWASSPSASRTSTVGTRR